MRYVFGTCGSPVGLRCCEKLFEGVQWSRRRRVKAWVMCCFEAMCSFSSQLQNLVVRDRFVFRDGPPHAKLSSSSISASTFHNGEYMGGTPSPDTSSNGGGKSSILILMRDLLALHDLMLSRDVIELANERMELVDEVVLTEETEFL